MHRQELLGLLTSYNTPFMEEAAMVQRCRQFVLQHENCFDRNLAHGHVTGSTWVVNPARTHVLMLLHRKLGFWLQPGGHADGDPDILRVVLKEAAEETGVDLANIRLLHHNIFDVDIHTIHESIHDPRHVHFDIRFLVEIDDQIKLPGNDESHQVSWIPLNQVSRYNNMRSIYRMLQKTRRLSKQSSS